MYFADEVAGVMSLQVIDHVHTTFGTSQELLDENSRGGWYSQKVVDGRVSKFV
jgi:hypothetical protein